MGMIIMMRRTMTNERSTIELVAGCGGGTLVSLLASLEAEDVVETIILAAIGTVVSFVLSHVLHYLAHRKR